MLSEKFSGMRTQKESCVMDTTALAGTDTTDKLINTRRILPGDTGY